VKPLAFSDVHRDTARARRLAEMAVDADVVIAAADFASMLEATLAPLREIDAPTLLGPGSDEPSRRSGMRAPAGRLRAFCAARRR
jgi:hypothetical protein